MPLDAAMLNFVVRYFEHYDNNDRQDFKVGGAWWGWAAVGWEQRGSLGLVQGGRVRGCWEERLPGLLGTTARQPTNLLPSPPSPLSTQALIDLPAGTTLDKWADGLKGQVGAAVGAGLRAAGLRA